MEQRGIKMLIKRCTICTPKSPKGGGVYFLDEEKIKVGENKTKSGWEIHCVGLHEGAPHPGTEKSKD